MKPDKPAADRPVRQKLSHAIPQWVDERSFYLITICCEPRGLNQLSKKDIGPRILDAAAFYHEQLKWHCRLWLLMPDHLHEIVCFPKQEGIQPLITAWKRYVCRQWGIQWQSNFFDPRLRDRFSLDEKTAYVLQNPVRAGLCACPEDWPFVYRPMNRFL